MSIDLNPIAARVAYVVDRHDNVLGRTLVNRGPDGNVTAIISLHVLDPVGRPDDVRIIANQMELRVLHPVYARPELDCAAWRVVDQGWPARAILQFSTWGHDRQPAFLVLGSSTLLRGNLVWMNDVREYCYMSTRGLIALTSARIACTSHKAVPGWSGAPLVVDGGIVGFLHGVTRFGALSLVLQDWPDDPFGIPRGERVTAAARSEDREGRA